PASRLPRGEHEPRGREAGPEEREPERDVSEREDRHGEREGEADPRPERCEPGREERQPGPPAAREEGERGGSPAGDERSEGRRREARRAGPEDPFPLALSLP